MGNRTRCRRAVLRLALPLALPQTRSPLERPQLLLLFTPALLFDEMTNMVSGVENGDQREAIHRLWCRMNGQAARCPRDPWGYTRCLTRPSLERLRLSHHGHHLAVCLRNRKRGPKDRRRRTSRVRSSAPHDRHYTASMAHLSHQDPRQDPRRQHLLRPEPNCLGIMSPRDTRRRHPIRDLL